MTVLHFRSLEPPVQGEGAWILEIRAGRAFGRMGRTFSIPAPRCKRESGLYCHMHGGLHIMRTLQCKQGSSYRESDIIQRLLGSQHSRTTMQECILATPLLPACNTCRHDSTDKYISHNILISSCSWKSAQPRTRVRPMVERLIWPCHSVYRETAKLEGMISLQTFS